MSYVKKNPKIISAPLNADVRTLYSEKFALMHDGDAVYKIVQFGKAKVTANVNKKKQLTFTLRIPYKVKFESANGTHSFYLKVKNDKVKKAIKKGKKGKKSKKGKKGKQIKCSFTIGGKSANKCSLINSKKLKLVALKTVKHYFRPCSAGVVTALNAQDICPAIDPSKIPKKTLKTHSFKAKVLLKVRALTKFSIKMNPGNNNKTIIRSFRKKIRKGLVGKVLSGSKYVQVVKKIKTRRVSGKLVITLFIKREYKVKSKANQIFTKVKKSKKPVQIKCVLSFKKELRSSCYLNLKKLSFDVKVKSKTNKMKICRFAKAKDLKHTSKSVYIDCANGVIENSKIEDAIQKQPKSKAKKAKKDGEADSETVDMSSLSDSEVSSEDMEEQKEKENIKDNFYLSEEGSKYTVESEEEGPETNSQI